VGIPELEAKQYEGKIKDGNILTATIAIGWPRSSGRSSCSTLAK
jgi:hypothetical protein